MNSTSATQRRTMIIAACTAAALAAGCLAWWIHSHRTPDTTTNNGSASFSCVQTAPHDDGYCERVTENVLRRRPPSPEQRTAAEQAHNEVRRAISRGTSCLPTAVASCSRSTAKHPPTDADAESARQSLSREGFPGSAARIARSNDPAPVGSLLYAAQIGAEACIVGHIIELPGGAGGGFIGGLLPNGSCLDD